jgi:hypothetical protein
VTDRYERLDGYKVGIQRGSFHVGYEHLKWDTKVSCVCDLYPIPHLHNEGASMREAPKIVKRYWDNTLVDVVFLSEQQRKELMDTQ